MRFHARDRIREEGAIEVGIEEVGIDVGIAGERRIVGGYLCMGFVQFVHGICAWDLCTGFVHGIYEYHLSQGLFQNFQCFHLDVLLFRNYCRNR